MQLFYACGAARLRTRARLSMIKHLLLASFFLLQLGCETDLASCVRSSDCEEQEQCINGLCYPEGTDASIGSSPCDECLEGWTCDEGRCVPGCELASCPPGLNCDPATDLCVSTPICLETEDCSTPTDDDCDELVACADPDCSGQTCDDGIWCNGEDLCAGGVCAATGVARCEGMCNEEMDSCGECTTDPDCGVDDVRSWGSCSYDGTCDASGTRTRMVTRHTCVGGMCMTNTTQQSDSDGCARNTQGISCGSQQRCFDGRCATRCSTGNDGSETCSTLCAWCGGSCSAAELQSNGDIESCGFRESGVRMWCYCTGI